MQFLTILLRSGRIDWGRAVIVGLVCAGVSMIRMLIQDNKKG